MNRFEQLLYTQMPRRSALQIYGETAAGGALFVHSTLRGREKPKAPESFDRISLGESLAFVSKEIQTHTRLADLHQYGEENMRVFAGHGYNIFAKTTGSALSPDDLLARTTFGGDKEMRAALAQSRQLMPEFAGNLNELAAGYVYPRGSFDNPGIILDLDLPDGPYSLRSLAQNPLTKVINKVDNPTVLNSLLYATTHEPHHVEEDLKPFDKPIILKASRTTHQLVRSIGLAFGGSVIESPQDSGSVLSNINESSVFYIQRYITGNQVGSTYHNYAMYTKDALDLFGQLMTRLGYPTPQSILALRRTGKGAVILLDAVTKTVPEAEVAKNPGRTRQEAAYIYLLNFDRALGSSNIPDLQKALRDIR